MASQRTENCSGITTAATGMEPWPGMDHSKWGRAGLGCCKCLHSRKEVEADETQQEMLNFASYARQIARRAVDAVVIGYLSSCAGGRGPPANRRAWWRSVRRSL